mgnify:CR=1 FL=1
MKDIKSTQSVNQLGEMPTNTRRQFFKKAAIGSALLTTVSSRPVWATAVGCTVSGQMSGNLSNPDWDECGSAATGKSPGYWKSWDFIFNIFIKYPPGVKWGDLSSDHQKEFKPSNGEGNALNVLYNWILAADESGGIIEYPAIDGVKTQIGKVLTIGPHRINKYDFNYSGALLSAAHPNIKFPFPNNQWTLQYLTTNYNDPETHDATHELVADFFGSNPEHLEPDPKLPLLTAIDREAAFNWAKDILGF